MKNNLIILFLFIFIVILIPIKSNNEFAFFDDNGQCSGSCNSASALSEAIQYEIDSKPFSAEKIVNILEKNPGLIDKLNNINNMPPEVLNNPKIFPTLKKETIAKLDGQKQINKIDKWNTRYLRGRIFNLEFY